MDLQIKYVEPGTGAALQLSNGGLFSKTSGRTYPIINGIPRFCPPESYADNFGDQWNTFDRTQLDETLENDISCKRLWQGTEWNPDWLSGKTLLEIGCGAGRFTGFFLKAGAAVWSIDLSSAVEACFRNHGMNENLHISQADVFALPFLPASFDFVFMYGVMQHTPSPEGALQVAVDMAGPGGGVAVDVYHRKRQYGRFSSKYRWRWLTTKLPPVVLRRFVSWYIPRWLVIDDWLVAHAPNLCSTIAGIVPCWNYRGILPLTEEQRVEWAILDTYDALGARYDRPFTRREFVDCLSRIRGIEFTVKRGGNGLEASITKLLNTDSHTTIQSMVESVN
jgi:SAM-dependent methyltransferase